MTIAPPGAITTRDWLDTAKTLAPVIAQYRDETERERRMAQPIFDAIRESEIIQMLVPRNIRRPASRLRHVPPGR